MTRKSFASIILLLLLGYLIPASQGYSAEQTPEQFVQDFYAWYFKVDTGETPAYKNDGIYTYVEKKTVEYVREQARMSSICYFTKTNTDWIAWKSVKIFVSESIKMYDDVFFMTVRFDLKDENDSDNFYVMVFVKKENNSFYIIKASDVYMY